MASAAAKTRDRNQLLADRRGLATKLLRLQAKIAGDLLAIDEAKDGLRDISDQLGESFTEELGALGTVEVKAGSEKKFKGTLPVLKYDSWLALSAARKAKLLADGIVVEQEQWQPARKASVTVRL